MIDGSTVVADGDVVLVAFNYRTNGKADASQRLLCNADLM